MALAWVRRRRGAAWLLAAGAAMLAGRAQAAQEPLLSDLVSSAAAYLEHYDSRLSAVISQETYSQTERTLEGDPAQEKVRSRAMKSQLLLFNAGDGTWLCFRDVFQVDGKTLADHVDRLARLLATSPAESAGAGSLANQITAESARYNLGGVTRNFNVPTMALTFLRRGHQSRSTFRAAGKQRKGSVDVHIVSFSENARPTLVRGSGDRDVPATGRFWIEDSGRIDRTELSLKSDNGVNATITVEYGPLPARDLFVPLSMHEHYGESITDQIEAFATYSDFVVPVVSVDVEGFKLAVERTGRGGGREGALVRAERVHR